MTEFELDEDAFFERFRPRPNHLNGNASFDGLLFETFGTELAFVRAQDPRSIWTVLTDDGGELAVVSGYHFVNRLGYLITTVPVEEDQTYYVTLEVLSEDAAAEQVSMEAEV
ncbi:MAG: hypothetical protein WC807_19590 [Hyphomicrobium sp.]|jgi:hypothetical protein